MADYKTLMEQTIEPFLQKYRKEFWMERDDEKKIYCLRFRVKNPKAVVVISHGFTENEEKYKENIYRFLKRNYSVYFMEHCGHGRSYRLVEDLSLVHIDRFERYVDDFLMLAHLAKVENPKVPIYVFGHSMGGGIAAAAVTKEPELFEKVVLSSPMIRLYTGKIPYHEARLAAKSCCMAGKAEHYVMGYEPYQGPKSVEHSSSMRQDQHDYYQNIRKAEPMFQTNAPSYGWMYEADRLNRYLRKYAAKNIKCPLLLFQAEREHLVSNKAQMRFILRLRKAGHRTAKLVHVRGSKHEAFNATKRIREAFWRRVFLFLET